MPQILPEGGKKLTNTTAAGAAAALAASNVSGQYIDPNVQRPFAIDPSEINDQAALEAISAATQPVQPVATASAVVSVGSANASQDIVEDSALLVELHGKIDKLLHKRGLCDSDHDSDSESDAEADASSDEEEIDNDDEAEDASATLRKPSTHKRQIAKRVTVKKPVSKKQKMAEELAQELDRQVSGSSVVETQTSVGGVSGSAIASGSVADLISKANDKLDRLLGDESDSDEDEEEENTDNEEDEE